MICGLSAIGEYPLCYLPAEYDNSVVDPLGIAISQSGGQRTYLVEIEGYNPDTLTVEKKIFASDKYRTKPSDPELPNFAPIYGVVNPGTSETSIMSGGRLVNSAIPTYGDVEIAIGDKSFDAVLNTWKWSGHNIVQKVGTPDLPYPYFGPFASGSIVGIDTSYDIARISVTDRSAALNKALQTHIYRGTGYALKFNGTSSYISLGTHSTNVAATFEAWIQCTGSSATVVASHTSGWTNTTIDWTLEIGTESAGILVAKIQRSAGSSTTILDSGIDMRDGIARHVALVLNSGTNNCKLYVNGILVDSGTQPGYSSNASAVLVCGRRGSFSDYYFTGIIDEVRYFNIARSRLDILRTMSREIAAPEMSEMFGYWQLNEAAGTVLEDVSGNANDGTAINCTWVGTYEGGADVAGTPKVLCAGLVKEFTPVPVDAENLIYQLHDGKFKSAIIKDDGFPLTFEADVADLYAVTVTAGQFQTDSARGYARLGSDPTGTLTASVEGEYTGAVYIDTPSAIIQWILIRGGISLDTVDLGSLATLDLLAPGIVHFYAPEKISIINALRAFMEDLGGYIIWTRAGLIKFGILTDPSTEISKGALMDTYDFKMGSLQREIPIPVTKTHTLAYDRHYVTLDGTATSGVAIPQSDKYSLAKEYRFAYSGDDTAQIEIESPDAEDIDAISRYTLLADAQREVDRRQALNGVTRYTYQTVMAHTDFMLNVGDVYTVYSDRYGLTTGKNLVIVGIAESASPEETRVTFWG